MVESREISVYNTLQYKVYI